jgi:hypothetical protein
MDPIAAVGVASSAINFISMTMKIAGALSGIIKSSDKDPESTVFHTRCFAEMAKMETSMQVLASYNDTQEGKAAVQELLQRAAQATMQMTQYLQSVGETSQRRSTQRSWDEHNKLLLEIVEINDELFNHVSDLIETESRVSSRQASNHYLDSASLEALNDASSSSPPQFTSSYGRGQILQRIIISVAGLLEDASQHRRAFAEVSNEFQLWRHHVESEGLFEALTLALPEKKRLDSPQASIDLGLWLMKIIAHLGHNLGTPTSRSQSRKADALKWKS